MRYVYIVCLLLNSSLSFAQDWTFYGFFPTVSQSGNLSKKLQYNFFLSSTIDAFPQTVGKQEFPATMLQYYIQPSIAYRITPNLQAGIGYAYVNHDLFGLHVNENRLWAQVVASHNMPFLGPARLSHRLRYEERYPLNLKTDQWSYATLVRYQLGLTMPFYDPKARSKGFYVSASDEMFFCMTGATNSPVSSKNAFYGENWLYGGVGYATGKFGKVELGYMHQNLIRNQQHDRRYLNLLQVSWAANFDLSDVVVWFYTSTN